jgi:diadenosine tetraphosphate (Ap4A) HIT family hydrolase
MNATLNKFGWPDSVIRSYTHWHVLLRPAQVTLGSLVVVCEEPVTHFGAVSEPAFTELARVVADCEHALAQAFAYERINWLMLMMVDPDVHFHVIPRYSGNRQFVGIDFHDRGWPGPPVLDAPDPVCAQALPALHAHLQAIWRSL